MNSKCPTCNRQIEAGEKVQKRSGRVRHVFCPTLKMQKLPVFPETAERQARSIAQARECGRTSNLEGLHILIRVANWCSETELRTAYEAAEQERTQGGN